MCQSGETDMVTTKAMVPPKQGASIPGGTKMIHWVMGQKLELLFTSCLSFKISICGYAFFFKNIFIGV